MGREKGSGEFWEQPKKAEKPAGPPMKRWKKIVFFGGGGLLLVLALLVLLAPAIAGAMAPGIISNAAAESIKGAVRVGNASFSWTGSQRVGPVTIVDPTKPAGSNEVATVTIEIDRGLMGLISGAMGSAPDLGEIKVSGAATLVRYPDGTTNLERALEPVKPAAAESKSKGGTKEPATIARGTKATVLIDSIDVTYTDETAPAQNAAIKGLRGEAYIGPGDAGTVAKVKLAAKATGGGGEGTVRVDLKASPLAGDDGVVRPDKTKVEAAIDVAGLPTALVDSLAGMGGKLAAGLGPTLSLNVNANGSMKSATAKIGLSSRGATVDGELAMADSVLTTVTPLSAKLTGEAVRALAGLDEAMKKSGTATLTEAPAVSASVDKLRVKLPSGGAPFDLAGTSGTVALRTTEMSGTLKLQGNGAPSPFKVSPIEAVLATQDAAAEASLKASGNATIGGQPAGVLSADIVARNIAGMLKQGAKDRALPVVEGTVGLKGVATAIAQPFVTTAGLELERDVGPTLDAEVKLATAASGAGVGALPPVTASLMIGSQRLNARGGFALKDSALISDGGAFTINADSVGGLIARFISAEAPYAIAPGGKLGVAVSDVRVPFKDGDLGKAELDKAGASVSAQIAGLAVVPAKAGAGAKLDVSSFSLGLAAAPGAAPKLDLKGAMAYGGAPFSLGGAMELPGLYSFSPEGAPMVTPVGARPKGSIEIKGVPTGVVSLFTGEKAAPKNAEKEAAPSLDMGRFLADVIGPGVDVKITSTGRDEKGVELDVAVRAEHLTADVQAGLSEKAIDVKRVSADATVAPSALDTVLATYAPNLSPRPKLAGVSKLTIGAEPVSIPITRDKDGAARLDLARAGIATLKVALPQQTLLEKMVLKNKDGSSTDLGQLGVEGLDLTAKIPLAAADSAGAVGQKFNVALSGRVLDGPGSALLKVAGTVGGELAAAGVRTADANLKVTDVRVASIDRLMGKPGFISGAVGGAAALNVDAKTSPAPGGEGLATTAEITVQSPKVKMADPIRLSILPDRISSDRTVQIAWTMDPAWANQYVFVPSTTDGGKRPTLAAPVDVNATINSFAVSTGQGRGPLLASVFKLGAAATISATQITMPDGATVRLAGTKVNLESIAGGPAAGGAPGSASGGAASAGVAFDIKASEVSVVQPGKAPPPVKGMSISGKVERLSDASGNVTPKAALVTATGDIPAFPTALIGAFSEQHAWLADLLGPTASAQIRAEKFGASGGTLDATATSERARASLRGNISDSVFATSEPFKASISEVTKELAQRFVKGMPLIGTVEKRPSDEPAQLTASGMRVPLDNDMSKLEGEVVIDPGVARFTSGDTFGKFLKAIAQKSESNIGERIEPLNVHIKQGVATYDRWTVPIGPNKLATQGTIDLVNQKLDIVTYIPLGALTEDVAGLFQAQAAAERVLGLAGLDNTLMVPFHSRGPFGAVKTEPDMELFVKDTLSNLRPDRVIERAFDNIFKPKGDK